MEADFSGYATKAGLLCSDGRTIMSGAFKHQDQAKVPLVWQHGHSDPENVLGHAILENRDDSHPDGGGVYAYAFLNKSKKAQHAREMLEHEDINMMSIWANQLVERSKRVLHGVIREVSLVLSGANPGALIENVTIRHSDGDDEILDDEVIIYTGLELEHADGESSSESEESGEAGDEDSVADVYESMSDKQKEVLHFMVGEALNAAKKADNSSDDESETAQHNNTQEGTENMTHNVFEKKEGEQKNLLSHADIQGIVADATKNGSLKDAVQNYALAHGIENLESLFPDPKALTTAPEWDKRRTEWVAGVLGGANKTPFSRVKTWTANITYEDARAKGYIKGNLKKEEFFTISQRVTTPQTVYKKQKLDRDDIIDITDFDVVTWLKGEMRLMLDEELARAILVGDGRDIADEDKIMEDKIRPIATDDFYYTIPVTVNITDANSSIAEAIDAFILNRQYMKGTGSPTFYTTENFIARVLLLKDGDGRRMYRNLAEVAAEMRVSAIVPVEVMEDFPNIIGIAVNMTDYTVGADKGGSVTLFDDFDIDYNQYKYLIETRISGALTKPKAALVLLSSGAADTEVTAVAPTWDPETWTYTIPVDANVNYLDENGVLLADGAHVLAAGDYVRIHAVAVAGKFLSAGRNEWSFMRPSGS